jgi:pimeloyl-ACP methyl ester carboxylesterase
VGELLDIRGVSTWHEVLGAGEPIVLLHGGLTNGDCFAAQTPVLAENGWKVHVPDRRGHGRSPDSDAPFAYSAMADEVIAYIEDVVGGPAHLVGYSDGGNAGLLAALARPDLVRRLVLISANFHHDGMAPGAFDFAGDDDPTLAYLGSLYAAVSPDGAEHWPVVWRKTVTMYTSEPSLNVDDLTHVATPTLVLAADDDVVLLSHTVEMYLALPEAQLAIIPGASHLAPMEQPHLVNQVITSFLKQKGPPETIMPVRRAHDA